MKRRTEKKRRTRLRGDERKLGRRRWDSHLRWLVLAVLDYLRSRERLKPHSRHLLIMAGMSGEAARFAIAEVPEEASP